MAGQTVLALSIAQQYVATGTLLKHEGKVLGVGKPGRIVIDLFNSNDLPHDGYRKCSLFRVIDQRRIVTFKVQPRFTAISDGRTLHDMLHALLDHVQCTGALRAHGATQPGAVRDHIDGITAVNLGNG